MGKNCLVAQSGGPTTAINASLAGILETAMKSDRIDKIYGALNGIQGVLNDTLIPLHEIIGSDHKLLQKLKVTPAMFLGSCRYMLADVERDASDYDRICEIFEKYDIAYFFYIGGNDSMDTVSKLSSYVKKKGLEVAVVGCPKTVDNDLKCTDHTPGYGSAAKYIATSVLEIAHDTAIYDMPTVVIVEIMGRNAGWLTAAAAMARNEYNLAPHLIYMPERAFETERFVCDVKKKLKDHKHVIVAVSEGIKSTEGSYVSAQGTKTDKFGHAILSGTGAVLEEIVKHRIGCKVRSIELNVLQRCAAHISSRTDVEEAFLLGKKTAEFGLLGETGIMTVCRRISDSPYEVAYEKACITDVANFEKKIPDSWIAEDGNDVSEEMLRYIRPLIEGEIQLSYVNGIPDYLTFSHLYK